MCTHYLPPSPLPSPSQIKVKPKKTPTSSGSKSPKLEPKKEAKSLTPNSNGEQERGILDSLGANGEQSMEVPDPQKPSGFERGLLAEAIMGATEVDGQILFLVKW